LTRYFFSKEKYLGRKRNAAREKLVSHYIKKKNRSIRNHFYGGNANLTYLYQEKQIPILGNAIPVLGGKLKRG